MLTIKFVDPTLLSWLYPDPREEIAVLKDLLLSAEDLMRQQIERSSRTPALGGWHNRTIYLLPVGVRSAGESELASLVLNYRESHVQQLPADVLSNLVRPVLFLISENTMHDWDAHRAVKNKQFYLQSASSYGLGRVVPYSELTEFLHNLLDELLTRLEEMPQPVADLSQLMIFPSTHRLLEADIGPHVDRVYHTFLGGLESLFRLQHDPDKRNEALRCFGLERINAKSDTTPLSQEERVHFLELLAVAYHVGRYRRAQFHAAQLLRSFGNNIGTSRLLKQLREDLIEEFRRARLVGEKSDGAPTEQDPMTTYGRLRIYYLLRDCARTLASAATLWVEEIAQQSGGKPEHDKDVNTKRRILLIDDNYRSDVNWRLTVIRDRLWKDRIEIDVARPGVWVQFSTWFETNWGNQVQTWEPEPEHLLVEAMPTFPSSPGGKVGSNDLMPLQLDRYDLILLDAEVEGRDRGPELVFWLDTLYHRQQQAKPVGPPGGGERPPRLMVLTDARPTESLQQCLNLGVETYLSKDRIFDLPFAVMQVVEPFGIRKDLGGSHDFRAVHQLPLRALGAIRSKSRDRIVTGNPASYLDRRWIKKLPKADLHYHIGTSISLDSISAMALNSMGHLIVRTTLPPPNGRAGAFLDNKIREVCRLVVDSLKETETADNLPQIMWASYSKEIAPPEVFDKLIGKYLHNEAHPIESFEIASVLVAAITYCGELIRVGRKPNPTACAWYERWRWVGDLGGGDPNGNSKSREEYSSRLWEVLEVGLAGWTGIYAEDQVRDTFLAGRLRQRRRWGSTEDPNSPSIQKIIADRAIAAWNELGRHIEPLWDDSIAQKWSKLYLFQEVVSAPDGGDRSLPMYLRGAGLLGADHLQFPENLILAALDITKQNVEDNVWYSELRCATNGYCNAGLGAVAATDILCRSFDLASAHWAEIFNNRWVSVNVLLGAKRHKPEEIPEVVSLMMSYLQRARPMSDTEKPCAHSPSWWRPSAVIGFDLSGNESEKKLSIEDLRGIMSQLLADCAQITIHAGEAASAENIWDAIYRLGARRIGHGLRLREHSRLLDHAMRLGICLELCPTSNALTNDFERQTTLGTDGPDVLYNPKERWHYPLRTYMEKNMQVCLNTDNRFLHRVHTVTDEYLEAARMVGGLSRLEILRLVRAGFSAAFLDYKQKDALLRQVDEVVYRLLSEHDEEVYGPNGS